MKQSLYNIIFTDGSTYKGGTDYKNTKWLEISINKKIKRIFYRLPSGDYLCLAGYDKYFHMIEATKDLNGKNKGIENIEYAYIMGKSKSKTIIYKIDLKSLDGNINVEIKANTDSFIKGLNFENWR